MVLQVSMVFGLSSVLCKTRFHALMLVCSVFKQRQICRECTNNVRGRKAYIFLHSRVTMFWRERGKCVGGGGGQECDA
jgi:hypothetical protein